MSGAAGKIGATRKTGLTSADDMPTNETSPPDVGSVHRALSPSHLLTKGNRGYAIHRRTLAHLQGRIPNRLAPYPAESTSRMECFHAHQEADQRSVTSTTLALGHEKDWTFPMTMQNGSAPKRAHNNHSNKNGRSCPPAGPKNRIASHIDERDPAPEAVPFSFRIMPLAAWVTIRHPWCVRDGKPLWVGVDPETDSIVYATTDAYPLADEWDRLEPIPEGLVCDELCPAADDGPITVYIGTRLAIGILKTLERDRTDAQIRVESFLSSGGMKTSREGGRS